MKELFRSNARILNYLSPKVVLFLCKCSQLALDGKQKIVNNLAVEFMGNYAPNTGYWSRARIPIGSTVKTGPEYVIQGNPNYQNQKIGWFISDIDIGSGFKTGVKAGYSKNNSLGGSMYFGLDLTKYIE